MYRNQTEDTQDHRLNSTKVYLKGNLNFEAPELEKWVFLQQNICMTVACSIVQSTNLILAHINVNE